MDNPQGVVHLAFRESVEDFMECQRDRNGTIHQAFSYGKNVKKMCPHKKILPYTYPSLHEGKVWYIGFYAEDPATGRMRRKRYKVERIKGAKAKRRYAQRMICQLMDMLDHGWNPWLPEDLSVTPPNFEEVCERYLEYVEARLKKEAAEREKARKAAAAKNAKSANKPASPAELTGLTVAYQAETTSDIFMEKQAAVGLSFKPAEFDKVINAYDELKLGRCDAVVSDALVYANYKDDPAFESTWTGDADEYFGVAIRKGNSQLLDKVNAAIDEMIADGTMKALYEKVFGADLSSTVQ